MSDSSEVGPVPAIEVIDVVKRYGRRTVLDGASLEVWPGEFVALVGPSGVGKSTLVHLIAALDVPDSGRIEVEGEEVGHHQHQSRYRRTRVGLVFQLHNLVPRLTALQNVELALFGSGLSRRERVARAHEVLAAVGLSEWAGSRPPTMSGGERQRVAIARALANRPPVLLADEPTGNLDDESAATVLSVLRRLADDEGVAVLAVSHDERLDRVVDRQLAMRDGRIVPVAPAPTSPLGTERPI
jgi:putative ABC transport system ATP-binding protein